MMRLPEFFKSRRLLRELAEEEDRAVSRIKNADNYVHGASENWAKLYTRHQYFEKFIQLRQTRSAFTEELWSLVRSLLKSDELTWDTMNLLFLKEGGTDGIVSKWAKHVDVPVDILELADRAVEKWDRLRSGNAGYAYYEANSLERRDEIKRILAHLRGAPSAERSNSSA
jgi:hypothetical protein